MDPTSVTRRKTLFVGAASLTALAGCTSDESETNGNSDPGSVGQEHDGPHNHDDVAYLMRIITSHTQALEMTALVPDRTDREELIELSETIETTYPDEIDRMESYLEEAGVNPDDLNLDQSDVEELSGTADQEFDRLFLEEALALTENVINRSETVIENGSADTVETLATEFLERAQADRETYEGWQAEWEE